MGGFIILFLFLSLGFSRALGVLTSIFGRALLRGVLIPLPLSSSLVGCAFVRWGVVSVLASLCILS